MFGSLEGRGSEGFGKKEGASGRNRRHWEERALEVNFLLIIKNPPHLGELKNCIGGGFWGVMEGLYEFFKFNLCCYNILKIKSILIISISFLENDKLTLMINILLTLRI